MIMAKIHLIAGATLIFSLSSHNHSFAFEAANFIGQSYTSPCKWNQKLTEFRRDNANKKEIAENLLSTSENKQFLYEKLHQATQKVLLTDPSIKSSNIEEYYSLLVYFFNSKYNILKHKTDLLKAFIEKPQNGQSNFIQSCQNLIASDQEKSDYAALKYLLWDRIKSFYDLDPKLQKLAPSKNIEDTKKLLNFLLEPAMQSCIKQIKTIVERSQISPQANESDRQMSKRISDELKQKTSDEMQKNKDRIIKQSITDIQPLMSKLDNFDYNPIDFFNYKIQKWSKRILDSSKKNILLNRKDLKGLLNDYMAIRKKQGLE